MKQRFSEEQIIGKAVHRLLSHAAPRRVEWGMAIMGASALTNVFVVRIVRRAAKETGSLALEAVSKDHLADIYAAVGVLLGLGLVRVTGQGLFDSLLAVAVAGLILHSAWELLRDAIELLMDTPLPSQQIETVRRILNEEPGVLVLDFHKLRTRKSGSKGQIDAHILLDDDLTLLAAHNLTEAVEDRIREALPHIEVMLHAEPFHAEKSHQQQAHTLSTEEPIRSDTP